MEPPMVKNLGRIWRTCQYTFGYIFTAKTLRVFMGISDHGPLQEKQRNPGDQCLKGGTAKLL
jgi:hypothetical protein